MDSDPSNFFFFSLYIKSIRTSDPLGYNFVDRPIPGQRVEGFTVELTIQKTFLSHGTGVYRLPLDEGVRENLFP